MAYSARQIHCLNAMGIVPWVSRNTVLSIAESACEEPMQTEPAASTPPQATLGKPTSTGHWISSQPLCVFSHRGVQVSSIGSTSASLLVVSLLSEDAASDAPLDTQASQLFDLMMRAIEIPKSDFRTCAMRQPGHELASAAGAPSITSLYTPKTRAIVLLDPSVALLAGNEKSPVDVVGSVSIENTTLPVWQLQHPDLLLQAPEHKRGTWEILKRFKQSLDN